MNIKNIPNQIIKQSLQPLNLSKVDAIALHHMDSNADVKGIEQIHINKGWRAIGYNFWVAFDGTVYRGRGFNLGAGVDEQNGHIISIGFQGDYHTAPRAMPDAQFNAGIDIINYVKVNVPSIKKVAGHKDFMATACPGKYFPLAEMQSGVKRGGNTMAKITVIGTGKNVKITADGKDIDSSGMIEKNGTTACMNVAQVLRELGHEVEWKAE